MAKRGRPKKIQEVQENGQEEVTQTQGEVLNQEPIEKEKPVERERRVFVEKPEASDAERIAESRKALLHPLPAGQKFFETPDGEIIIGDADKNHIWSRHMNAGKGGWVNPRR